MANSEFANTLPPPRTERLGRPASGTTELDSGAQMHLRRSRIEGYGPRPQARARLARAAVVPPASAWANSRSRTAGHCGRQRASPVRTFSTSATLHRFPNFYTSRVEVFRMFFIRSRLRMNNIKHETFHGNRSACFLRNLEDRHTDRRGSFIYNNDLNQFDKVGLFTVSGVYRTLEFVSVFFLCTVQ